MKKFLAIFFIIVAANFSVARAGVIKISEIDVQQFVHSIAGVIYSEEFQKEIPLFISNAAKFENAELPEIGSAAYVCQYGLKTATAPEGEIIFFVDGEEKVSALKIVGYSADSAKDSVVLLMLTLSTLGLTQADAEFLVNNLNDDEFLASSIVWSEAKQRCFVLMAGARTQSEEGFQFMLIASDKKD